MPKKQPYYFTTPEQSKQRIANRLVFAFLLIFLFLGIKSSAQVIQVIPNPDNGLGDDMLGSAFTKPVVYNGKLYYPYKNTFSRYQLAESDGTAVQLITNPDLGGGVQGHFILFAGKLYMRYLNSIGIYQLAEFDGSVLKLISSPANVVGYTGSPVVYNNKLYVQVQTGTSKWQLGVLDGSLIRLIPNVNSTDEGYADPAGNYHPSPFVYNNKLYIQYKSPVGLQLAQYDGNSLTLIPNPDNGNVTTELQPILYEGAEYFFYRDQSGVIYLAKFDGASIILVPNIGSGTPAIFTNNQATVYNGKLYFGYSIESGLAVFDGNSIIAIPSQTGSPGFSGLPIIYNNSLFFQSRQNFQPGFTGDLAQFNGVSLNVIPIINRYSGLDPSISPVVYNNSLFWGFYEYNQYEEISLAQYNESGLTKIPNQGDGRYLGEAIEFNGMLYFQYYSNGANHLAYLCATVSPSFFEITADTLGPVCSGTTIKFRAVAINAAANLFYQWKINGDNVGSNSDTFTTSTLKDSDTITCSISNSNKCFGNAVISNPLTILFTSSGSPDVSINSSANNYCEGANVVFTAMAVNGGTAPIYQWQLNGVNAGTNSSSFSSAALKSGDKISCSITSNQACLTSLTAASNELTMQVNPLVIPTVTIAADKAEICRNENVTIKASVTNAGAAPQYQWKLNGNTVPGGNDVFAAATFNNGDQVTCTLTSNAACAVNPALSNTVTIKVNPLVTATVSIAASPGRICKGEEVKLNATGVNAGTAPLYQWMVNGLQAGNNSSNFGSTSLSNGDRISCDLTSSLGCTSKAGSNEVIIQVDPLPTITFNPSERLIFYGDAIQLTPAITGAIATYLWTPADNLSSTSAATVVANPIENKTYQLAVTSVNGCKANASVTVKVFRDLLMPNAFSPNGDGRNDVFRIPPGLNIGITHFIIFNRYGEKVFETSDSNKVWDGKMKSKVASIGAYTWLIEYFNPFENKNVRRKGTVMLVQ